ncbi:MAG: RNA methyltransferase [Chloroflexi bacterium]|nr:RNA methyltransferase [Chloroflexota bacterium]
MITSTSNARVKWVRALQTRPHARREEDVFVVEGIRMAYEAVIAELPVRLVFHTDHLSEQGRGLVNSLARLGAEVQTVSESVMAASSSTQTPPGLLVVLPIPKLRAPGEASLSLVIDRIADPGNLGSILRTALAVGVDTIYLMKGSVDPFNPKVVRAGMGAQLHLPILPSSPKDIGDRLSDVQLWVAQQGEGVPYYAVDWLHPVALAIGSEAHGASDILQARAQGRVHIPMQREAESLNAGIAAAVILFEIKRQRDEK